MHGRDQRLSIVHGERIDLRPLGFPQTCATEALCWVLVGRAVSVTEIEGTLENADDIVVGLLAPGMTVGNRYKMRIADLGENEMANLRTPDAVEYLSLKASFAVGEIVVEDIGAQSRF